MGRMKVIVASTKAVKINAAAAGFAAMFPEERWEVSGCETSSGIAEQPMTSDETLLGARNRARNAKDAVPDADFWVGLEGGIEDTKDGMIERAWMAVIAKDGLEGIGSTGTFMIPPPIAARIRAGETLGEASDAVFAAADLRSKNGAVGMLTGDAIHRTSYYEHAMILALIPFKNRSLFRQ
jgi:inosine/xanthosine triphosphatase